ncbi:hypothetical protein [Micromonospora sp. NPDC049301]|uniref:hypothetical protein n=1 Tax=Micromonospora sp. NPDC049301 TaxID=3155723 RepID=UPI003447A613
MDANTITAICATGIAVASLAVSVSQTRAVQEHNRRSIRPFLQFEYQRRTNGETGLRLRNVGLGPAVVTGTTLTLDGEDLGSWEEPTVNKLRRSLRGRPRARTLRLGMAIPTGYDELLLHLDNYDRNRDEWFWDLIRRRLLVQVHYDSIYGGEQFSARSDNPYDDQLSESPAP